MDNTFSDTSSRNSFAEALDCLASETAFYSKLGFTYDPPRFDRNGELIRFYSTEKMMEYHRNMFKRGIRLHSSLLFSGWIGDNRFDYRETDRVLAAVASLGPAVRYLPRVKFNAPLDWGKNHPEELCVYFDGPRDRESIRAIAGGSPRQDILGYDGDGYYAIGFRDDRPNRNGLIANQSFSSELWRHDAAEALTRLIHHVQNSPWHDMIIGWHIAYGNCGETALWGSFNQPVMHTGDFGINHRRAFFDWGMAHYGTLEKLREAWNLPELTRDNAAPPPPSMRQGSTREAEQFFRNSPKTRICVDYDRFLCEKDAESLEFLCMTAKKADNKPAGGFYGYYMNLSRAAYAGHCAYDRVLSSPWVDFLCAPAGYYRREVGEPGGEQVCAQSITKRKLFLDELDLRTHLAQEQPRAANWAQSRYLLWREFAKCMMYNSNFWWMDLGGGWFDCAEIADETGKLETLARRLRAQPCRRSEAPVLVLSSDESFCYHRPNSDLHRDLMLETVSELQLCAVPLDHYRLADLPSLPLNQYRIVIILNAFEPAHHTMAYLHKNLPEGTPVVWMYTSGLVHDEDPLGLPLESHSPPPQFSLKYADLPERHFSAEEHVYPFFAIDCRHHPEITVLARYSDGTPAAAETKWEGRTVIRIAAPLLGKAEFRKILLAANIVPRSPHFAACYGDSRFYGCFDHASSAFAFYEKAGDGQNWQLIADQQE